MKTVKWIIGALVLIVKIATGAYFYGKYRQKQARKTAELREAHRVEKNVEQAVRDAEGDSRPVDEKLSDVGGLREN